MQLPALTYNIFCAALLSTHAHYACAAPEFNHMLHMQASTAGKPG
jgi:hypothetical protein